MYYSKPEEVWAAWGWTQDYRQAILYILKKQSKHMSRCKEPKHTDKNKCFVFFFFSVVAHYATDWNLDIIHRAELWLWAKTAKKNQRWSPTPAGSCWSSAEHIPLQLTYKASTFYFHCRHAQSSPSSCLSISILHSNPPLLSLPTQRGPSWDINHAVN